MNFKIKLSKNIISILILILILILYLYINQKDSLIEGLSNNGNFKALMEKIEDDTIASIMKVNTKEAQNIMKSDLLSPIEKIEALQKTTLPYVLGKEKQVNIDVNKLIDLTGTQKVIIDMQNKQVDLENQLKELNKQKNTITSKHADKIGRQFFGSAARAVTGSKPVSDGIRNHLRNMNQDEPFGKNDGLPGSHGNDDLNKCLAADSCQTKAFYKGNYIPTGNALYGSCPCPALQPNAYGAHWSCCAVPT
tara:strand:+ start:114 stop:863 length:750 start_codon:yes stop_codon:yes gene_type:complete